MICLPAPLPAELERVFHRAQADVAFADLGAGLGVDVAADQHRRAAGQIAQTFEARNCLPNIVPSVKRDASGSAPSSLRHQAAINSVVMGMMNLSFQFSVVGIQFSCSHARHENEGKEILVFSQNTTFPLCSPLHVTCSRRLGYLIPSQDSEQTVKVPQNPQAPDNVAGQFK